LPKLHKEVTYLKFVACDFSLSHYVDTVNDYREAGYKLIQVKDLHTINDEDKYLLIRHDVDLSLKAAEELSAMEHVHGIPTSYYILLYSPIYNPLAPDNLAHIKQIAKYGHEIGLHVDSRYERTWDVISDDMRILSNITGTVVNSYVQHFINETPEVNFPAKIDGLRDVRKARFKYLSESSMNWREGCFCNHVDKYKRLTVAIHPEWHVMEGKRGQIIDRARDIEIARIARETQLWIDTQVNYLKQFGKEGINA
jgi:hypothetical protein